MPNPAVTTNYAGESISDILQLMVIGNEAVEKDALYIVDQSKAGQKEVSIGRMTATSDLLQDRQAEPTNPSNALTYDERKITPLEFMFYDKFNPRNFEQSWRQFQPEGPLVDRVNNSKIQKAIMEVLTKRINQQIGKLIWQGDKTTLGALRFFDGFVTLAKADTNVIDVTPAGNITETNVQALLKSTDAAIPDALYDDPSVVFMMNTTDTRKFQDSIIALTQKGQGPAEEVPLIYKGRKIMNFSGFPANFIMAAKIGAGPDSNLWGAVDMQDDPENLKIERWRPESELFFIKALGKMAVNYGFGQEIVLYQPA